MECARKPNKKVCRGEGMYSELTKGVLKRAASDSNPLQNQEPCNYLSWRLMNSAKMNVCVCGVCVCVCV